MNADVVSPKGACTLMQDEGYLYLDVRTALEFHQGHPAGAYNIPVMLRGERGMEPNPRFVDEVQAHFSLDTALIVGCKMGGRSQRASALLLKAGFSRLVDQSAGFDGSRDPFGRAVVPGWKAQQLPVDTIPTAGRDYASLLEGES
jgi:rhodanese-related sulfurtransferase